MKYIIALFALFFCAVSCKTEPIKNPTTIRKVKVDRTKTAQQALDAIGRAQFTIQEVVNEMPIGESEEIEIHLISFKKTLTASELEQEVDKLGFKLVDPVTLCALNEQDPALADTIPNATQWRDKNGKACCAIFDCWHGEREVFVYHNRIVWHDRLFFGCVRK